MHGLPSKWSLISDGELAFAEPASGVLCPQCNDASAPALACRRCTSFGRTRCSGLNPTR
jgi:hypothetical protein